MMLIEIYNKYEQMHKMRENFDSYYMEWKIFSYLYSSEV